jgi:hypothetical protein
MREVHIYRADGHDSPPVLIRIEYPLPVIADCKPGDYAVRAAARFASEGAALAEAIWSSCPGGTVDAAIAALLARRSSLLRVTFPQENNRG